jgi:hypothetical protein
LKDTAHGEVDGLGAAGGEGDLAGLDADEVGRGLAGELDLLAGGLAGTVDAGGVVPVGGEGGVDCGDDGVAWAGGGVVVEVDDGEGYERSARGEQRAKVEREARERR